MSDLFKQLVHQTCTVVQPKKNAEHTRMHINFRAFLANIHVGCCLFSHNPNNIHKKKKTSGNDETAYYLFCVCWSTILSKTCTVVQTRKKMRSTHACTPSFAHSLFSIFTLVVVYSRTNLPIKTKLKKKKDSRKWTFLVLFISRYKLLYKANLIKERSEKKCGAHTHVRHLFATFSLNIHVGCCLFSHNKIKGQHL